MRYEKPHKSPENLVKLLISKGLITKDEDVAVRFINRVGLNRLKIYLESRRDVRVEGKPFIKGTRFEEIMEIYNFDEQLRALIFPFCARIEVTFRNAISEELTKTYGSHPYLLAAFKRDTDTQDAMRLLSEVYFSRLSQDRRAKYYFEKYTEPALPPIWVLKELFTFEKSVRFFSLLNDTHKKNISQMFGFKVSTHDIFTSWIKPINDLRNICAHHDRLFNRKFQKQPQNYQKEKLFDDADPAKIAGILKCMDFLGASFYDDFDSFGRVKGFLSEQKVISPEELGITL